ncbi:MarR family winged helix-turn-helix transcriptional regulator [Paenibacillus jilunlii]|uniref:DNA-binding transcriptional regulator, MarR family n=2 Tax=Paenibacillus jilunlii TaxID=682956 RepID=A0A1G9Z2C4_9BACL|nr:MarR family transcriptional regulator [Paenibacillus jilunlii]SDN14891.1 DNA-binding transcriptional regulator, MarR family [Paenibacillus jilunlii]
MTDEMDDYENIDALIEAFQQFSRLNWRRNSISSLKPSELRMLVSIRQGNEREGRKGQTVSDLSKQLKVTSPTVTQMVNSLISQGYAIRTTDAQDRRISEITLTDRGEHLAELVTVRTHETFKGMIDYLGKEPSDTLRQLLNSVYDYFEQLNNRQDEF